MIFYAVGHTAANSNDGRSKCCFVDSLEIMAGHIFRFELYHVKPEPEIDSNEEKIRVDR